MSESFWSCLKSLQKWEPNHSPLEYSFKVHSEDLRISENFFEINPPLIDCLTNSVFFFSFYLDEPLTICTTMVVEAGKTSSLIHKESNFCPVTLRHSLIVIAVFSSLDKMTKSDEVTGREKAIWNWLFLLGEQKSFQNFFIKEFSNHLTVT